jgi:ubiquitin carboxyl-terminal hydrolase 25/28
MSVNQGYSDALKSSLSTLGVTKTEEADAIRSAYHMQCTCDEQHRPLYLSALAALSEDNIIGKEDLQMLVMMERSMGKYTLGASRPPCMLTATDEADEVQQAYARIGYTVEHASEIDVEASDAPVEYILDLHKKAVTASTSSVERQEVFDALKLIGRHRGSDEILGYANEGKTVMSVQDAYEALSCPMDAVDDGLIMYVAVIVGNSVAHYVSDEQAISNGCMWHTNAARDILMTRSTSIPARRTITANA